ncbi:MAG: zinc ABC transporter solute-binding protein [Clostridium sp.]|nr:zinc ABC transporter solute-binding protein [Clostridium sp.]
MKKIISLSLAGLLSLSIFMGCSPAKEEVNGKFKVVTTTTLAGDLVKQIGKDNVDIEFLMGPGVDPHLYKASAGDVAKMENADMVVYGGLHLEGKMGDVFENIEESEKLILAVTKDIDNSKLLDFVTSPGSYDPHVWFDLELWKIAALSVKDGLIKLDEENTTNYEANYDAYIKELTEAEEYIRTRVEEVPQSQRIFITAHDAFQYFGRAYGFEVRGLQGISTDSEAGTQDVRKLADYIVDNQIKAIFVESSVPRKNIEALQEAVQARGFEVEIGGELYSDSTGNPGTEVETFIGTVKENIDTIVDALK